MTAHAMKKTAAAIHAMTRIFAAAIHAMTRIFAAATHAMTLINAAAVMRRMKAAGAAERIEGTKTNAVMNPHTKQMIAQQKRKPVPFQANRPPFLRS